MSATRLLRDGAEVRVRPQALQALKVLLRHNGETIRYEQMIAEAWQGTNVSRHTVDVTVGEVKKSLLEYGTWIVNRPKVGYRLEVPKSDDLVRRGWHFWNRRTPEGFQGAVECFQQAAAQCPSDFRAFEGLSSSYLMLATFGMHPPRDMYPRFLDAYNRAADLGVVTPELRCNHAHGAHIFERAFQRAETEFLDMLHENPGLASAYVRLARLYGSVGRSDEALEVLARGQRVDPLLPTMPVMEVLIRLWRREFGVATVVGAQTLELHPYLQIARATYGQALEFSGRLDEALLQYRTALSMSPNVSWLRAHEGTCLAKRGQIGDATAILEALNEQRQSEYVDGCFMAVLRAAIGQRDEAFHELDRARDDNSAWLHSLDVDPNMDVFRADPRFVRLRGEIFTREDS